jgi:hypothetical protein
MIWLESSDSAQESKSPLLGGGSSGLDLIAAREEVRRFQRRHRIWEE